MKKAYGIPITDDHDNCVGIVLSEDGDYLGSHVSSNYSFLKNDLRNKKRVLDYDFQMENKPNTEEYWRRIVASLVVNIIEMEDELKEIKGDGAK